MKKDKKGICYLVGAGPGDLGLLTLKAKECLNKADVIFYDYLANPALLNLAPENAERLYVGKKAGEHSFPQEEINAKILQATTDGRTVVRLKGGDPFIFGRGGEEAEALHSAGIAFEIVPGISSALAGAAYAGIPATHRDHNTQLILFTGHEDPTKQKSTLDFQALANNDATKIMFMGIERLEEITQQMRDHGANPKQPAALIRWATTGKQETLIGTLETIAKQAEEKNFRPPAIAVFGSVINLREKLQWFEPTRPLLGQRIVVTRTRKQASSLSQQLTTLGADVLELPTIRIEPPKDKKTFVQLISDAHTYDWLLFTSPNGVEAFFEAFYTIHKDARVLGKPRIAAIGAATAKKIHHYRFEADIIPDTYIAEELAKAIEKKEGTVEHLTFLYIRAKEVRETLTQSLVKAGAIVDELIAYRTVPETRDLTGAETLLREQSPDWITFTSSSTVEHFLSRNIPIDSKTKIASIGPITSATLRKHKLKPTVEATQYNVNGIAKAILDYTT